MFSDHHLLLCDFSRSVTVEALLEIREVPWERTLIQAPVIYFSDDMNYSYYYQGPAKNRLHAIGHTHIASASTHQPDALGVRGPCPPPPS